MPSASRTAPNRNVKKSGGHTLLRFFIVVAVVAVLGIGGAVLYYSDLFGVESVSVSGVSHLTASEMTSLAAVPSNTTLLRVDASGIESRLKTNPWVESANVNRQFPHTLELAITERTIQAVVTITSTDGQASENWAIASDGMWLMKIPDQDSDQAKNVSSQVYEDAQSVLHITGVPYGVRPQEGAYCTDASVTNALNIVSGLTTDLANQVCTVSATDSANTILTLDNGVQIAFGTAEDIRSKERICIELMGQYPDSIAYINVRVVERPTWRALES